MKPLPCRICGSAPVLLEVSGHWQSINYVCPKAMNNECRSIREAEEQKALEEWTAKNV